ncbi:MAG: hypothetical protein AVDCRST_MAG27-3060, partial [uncultured Craurococcus sp.]
WSRPRRTAPSARPAAGRSISAAGWRATTPSRGRTSNVRMMTPKAA